MTEYRDVDDAAGDGDGDSVNNDNAVATQVPEFNEKASSYRPSCQLAPYRQYYSALSVLCRPRSVFLFVV